MLMGFNYHYHSRFQLTSSLTGMERVLFTSGDLQYDIAVDIETRHRMRQCSEIVSSQDAIAQRSM